MASVVAGVATAVGAFGSPQGDQRPPQPPPPAVAPAPVRPAPSKADIDRRILQAHSPAPHVGGYIGDPYPLDVCVVSKEPLGPSAVTFIYTDAPSHINEGRHLRFCCDTCLRTFKASPQGYLADLDRRIIQAQKPAYPLRHCPVDIEARIDGAAGVDFVYGNRLYRLSTESARLNFSKSLKRFVPAYEKELMALQRARYPLATCVVTGSALPEKPYDLVIGARLIRLADEAAAARLYADPAPYLAQLEAAYAALVKPAEPARTPNGT